MIAEEYAFFKNIKIKLLFRVIIWKKWFFTFLSEIVSGVD